MISSERFAEAARSDGWRLTEEEVRYSKGPDISGCILLCDQNCSGLGNAG